MAKYPPLDESFTFCLQNLAPSTYIAEKIDLLTAGFQKIHLLTYMKKIGVLEGCFGRWFTVSLQKQKSPHLIGQKSGTFPPLWQKVYILFTEINTPHLIGQKIAVLKGVPLKIYNLFTDQGYSLLNSHGNCKKSRLFSKNLSSHYIAMKMRFWRGIGENDLQLVYKSNKYLT